MAHGQHTPLDIGNSKQQGGSVLTGSKESEPHIKRLAHEQLPYLSEQGEKVIHEQNEVTPNEDHGEVEVIPEEVELDEELESVGVESATHSTFFAGNKEIQLPMPIEELETAQHEPPTSARRWIALIVKFILAKFHKTIRRIGGILQIVDQE